MEGLLRATGRWWQGWVTKQFEDFLIFIMCVYVHHLCVGAHRGQKLAPTPLELEF